MTAEIWVLIVVTNLFGPNTDTFSFHNKAACVERLVDVVNRKDSLILIRAECKQAEDWLPGLKYER